MKKDHLLFLDGKRIAASEKLLLDLAPWQLKGKGAFETILAHDLKAVLSAEHLKRLNKGLKYLKIKNPCPGKEIAEIITELLKVNQLRRARVRAAVWQDKKGAHCSIVVMPFQDIKKGFKLIVSPKRWPFSSRPSFLKSIDYKFFHKAFEQAKRRNADEAVILNRKCEVVEGSRSNIFLVKEGKVMTPPLPSGCLNGITRQKVLSLIKRSGLVCQSKNIRITDLKEADEIFLTNSLIGIKPVASFMGKKKKRRTALRLMGQYHRLLKSNL